MKSSVSRRRAPKKSTILAVVAASIAVHAGVLLAIHVHRLKPERKAGAKEAADSELEYSCAADASLAASARIAYCATPFAAGPAGDATGATGATGAKAATGATGATGATAVGFRACAGNALSQYRYELITCRGKAMAASLAKSKMTVALVNPKQLAKINPKKLAKITPKEIKKLRSLVPIPPSPPKQQPHENKQAQKQPATKQKKPPAPRKKIQRPNQQVVEITPPKQQQAPDNARYLSSYNSRVKQETVARGSTEKMVARPGPKHLPTAKSNPHPHIRRPDTAVGPMQQPQKRGNPDFDRGKGHGKTTRMAMRTPRADKAPGNLDGFERLAMNGMAPRRGKGGLFRLRRFTREHEHEHEGGGRGSIFRKMAPRSLRPSDKLLSRLAGGGSVDDLHGAKRGEITALNTKEWKFATFFNRLKRQVAQHWHPDRVYMERDPTGRIYGTKDRITIVRVALNPDGSIHQIYVVRGSGVGFLDNEAVRAFRAAQPFPHPPHGLVDASSHLITFSFGFHFVINADSGSWHIFRYR